jgi:hypothetical protein
MKGRVEERCPECGKLLTVCQDGKLVYAVEDRCWCQGVLCPRCPECCALLETPALRA